MEEIKNAVIRSVAISIERGFVLEAWLHLDYDGSGQGFGGFALYMTDKEINPSVKGLAGHFIARCMQIGGVEKWEDLKGKTIRVKAEHSGVKSIGHIIKEDWFTPSIDFKNE